ncbi:MAG: DUF262 domain-containing HNH endonuclease family protein [Oscillospiraceae bacterium]|nr:DUF262 domain-containing HNH endonuclease family protein [Oscillospiraceae bacterium]
MAFQTALTIKEIISDIDGRKYLLPSIQREFVWGVDQITQLFDSLMLGYPIGSFLFWEVDGANAKKFAFYEFLRNYHEKNCTHNSKANIAGGKPVTAILDGQQRLTSLYVGLLGTYAYKMPYRPRDNPKAYPTRKLYLNLLEKSDEDGQFYDFAFLIDDECVNDKNHYWFLVSDIMGFEKLTDAVKYLPRVTTYLVNLSKETGEFDEEKAEFATETLSKLWQAIHSDGTISYYLERSSELDKVLNIFIRVNSGGTPLSYSDLLLSIASAQWDDLDAREEIHKAVDDINAIGRGFNVNKDFILKACLVLSDFTDIAFKVDNFNRKNMMKIQGEWDNIITALHEAVTLVSRLGFNRDNITSNNLFIPIAYFIKHIGFPHNFAANKKNAESVRLIKRWFISAMLKRVFSFQPDGVLRPMREIIKKQKDNVFPFEAVVERFKGTNRTHEFTDEDIESLLQYKYGQGGALVVMSILYPWADMSNLFHLDHVFPKAEFVPKKLRKRGIKNDEHNEFIKNFNFIGNLQLLEGYDNISKSDKDFKTWFEENYKSKEAQLSYRQKHLIPYESDLLFENFPEFFKAREKIIIEKLKNELQG